MMKKIVLFQPRQGYYDLLVRDIPLGLLSISRYLHKKYEIIIIDQRVKGWKKQLDMAMKEKPSCFGVTCTTGQQIQFAIEISQYVKKKGNIPIIWGGVHPTLMPEQTVANNFIDFVIEGEGEVSFTHLIEALEGDKDFRDIAGVWYKENGCLKKSKHPDDFLDLDQLPFLPYRLINFSRYSGYAVQNFGNIFFLESGRGCPYRCSYCYNSGFGGRNWRIMSAERIIEHIRYLAEHVKLQGVTFIDDNFFASRQRTLGFIKFMKDQGINIRWTCETGINELKEMDHETLKDLQDIGLAWMSIGVESGSERILESINKRISISDVIDVNKRLSRYNVAARYNFMSGFISEQRPDLKKTIALISELLKENPKANIQSLQIAVPYPETKYFNLGLKYGLSQFNTLEKWRVFNPDDWVDYCPWLNKRDKQLLKVLYVSSLFIDRKVYLNTPLKTFYGIFLRFIFLIYYPIAKLRFHFCFDWFPFEVKLFDIMRRLYAKVS